MSNKDLSNLAEALGYSDGLVTRRNIPSKIKSGGKKYNVAKQTFEIIPEIDGIYFSGDHPLIYFKNLRSFSRIEISEIQRKVWNQGRVPLLFITFSHEVRIYNCYQEPVEDASKIDNRELDRFTQDVADIAKLKSIYHQSKIDGGWFWETESGKRIHQTASRKVDKLLINNLKGLRAKLWSTLRDKVNDPLLYIHNVLARSLFVLYLEDRKIITSEYYSKFLTGALSYFDILKSKNATYDLFEALNLKFNGDIFNVAADEKKIIGQPDLLLVRDCFFGHSHAGQLSMWRMFDFSCIPIELLSAIYEEFLHTTEGDDLISDQGAYYTPLSVVEFVLNEVLPFPDESNKNYEIKILDPACGSGIFLVESYKRLIERWRYSHPGQRVSTSHLKSILLNSIFGIEKNSEAIKVASFSLYLTILNYLEPKFIWDRVKFPFLIHSTDRVAEKRGKNLVQGDTFEVIEHDNIDFNLVVGNPPWKRGNLDETLSAYVKEYKLGSEAVLPFLHKMAFSAPNAVIALVSTAKILFNTTSGYQRFRKFLFSETKVDAIVNFSALRKSKGEIGRKLFDSATGPTIILFYNGVNIKVRNESIVYCTPKPQLRDAALNELVIDSSDIKFVPLNEALNPDSKVWKVAMWGTMRDFNFVKHLQRSDSLKDFFSKNGWAFGNGFQLSHPTSIPDSNIKTLPHIPSKRVVQFYTPKECTIQISNVKFRRLGSIKSYKAPHVLIKKGQSKKEFCASYLDYDCSFMDGVYGVHAFGESIRLKALTGYLNSKFATYFLFLTSSSWGIEREQIFASEVLTLPVPPFLLANKPNEIVQMVDEVINSEKEFSLKESQNKSVYQKKIDNAILKEMGLHNEYLALIENAVDFSLSFFQDGIKSESTKPVQVIDLEKYTLKCCSNLGRLLVNSTTNFWSTTYNVSKHYPLAVISIHFDNNQTFGANIKNESDIEKLIAELNVIAYDKYGESVFFRKTIKHFTRDTLFIVKPNERRFWTEAMALEDSDSVAFDIMTSKDEKA